MSTKSMGVAVELFDERMRQVVKERYSHDGDDQYRKGELGDAAASYCITAEKYVAGMWPWDDGSFKPDGEPMPTRHDLVRAGALIIAEIERIDRAATADEPKDFAQQRAEGMEPDRHAPLGAAERQEGFYRGGVPVGRYPADRPNPASAPSNVNYSIYTGELPDPAPDAIWPEDPRAKK